METSIYSGSSTRHERKANMKIKFRVLHHVHGRVHMPHSPEERRAPGSTMGRMQVGGGGSGKDADVNAVLKFNSSLSIVSTCVCVCVSRDWFKEIVLSTNEGMINFSISKNWFHEV